MQRQMDFETAQLDGLFGRLSKFSNDNFSSMTNTSSKFLNLSYNLGSKFRIMSVLSLKAVFTS